MMSGMSALGWLCVIAGVGGMGFCAAWACMRAIDRESLEPVKSHVELFGAIFFGGWTLLNLGTTQTPPLHMAVIMAMLGTVFVLGLAVRVPQVTCGAPHGPAQITGAAFSRTAPILAAMVFIGYAM